MQWQRVGMDDRCAFLVLCSVLTVESNRNIAYNGGVMSVFGPIKKLLLDVQIIDCDFQNNHVGDQLAIS